MKAVSGVVIAWLVLTVSAGCANAQGWLTKVDDDIVNDGKTATMVGVVGPSLQTLLFRCSSSGDLMMAYVERDTYDSRLDNVPATIFVKVDGLAKHTIDAEFFEHNAKYMGMRAKIGRDALVRILDEIGRARSKIAVGFHIAIVDGSWSGSISARGSTAAVGQFVDACGLHD